MSNVPPPPPPPPPPPGDMPPPASGGVPGAAPFSTGEPFSYGWKKFTEDPLQWILLILVVFAGLFVTGIVYFFGLRVAGSNLFLMLLVGAFIMFLGFALVLCLQYGLVNAALGVTEGKKPSFGTAWEMSSFGNYAITAVLVALIVGVGFLLCYIPGIIAQFLLIFAPFFAIDKKMAPVDAIKASFEMVKNNVGTVLVYAILASLIYMAGAIVCGIGILVTGPLVLISAAFVYRRVNGQPVAA